MRRSPPRLAPAALAVLMAAATAGSINAESASVNASVAVMPLAIALELSTLQASAGETVRVRATVANVGPTRVSNVSVELRVDASAMIVKEPLVATIARLQPGRATSIAWNVCATRTGNYLVLARATVDAASIESEARLLTIADQRKRGCR